MTRTRNILATIACMLGMVMFTTSCEHKDLCYHHPHSSKMRIDVDWAQFDEVTPTGMSVMLFNETDGSLHTTALSNDITHAYFTLTRGEYHSIVFNQSPSEFGTVLFHDMDNYHNARVVTNRYLSRWYVSRSDDSREVADQPEWIAADRSHNIVVTDAMVTEAARCYAPGSVVNPIEAQEFVIDTLVPLNIIHTLNVKVNMTGIQELRSARASITGLAEGYIFSTEMPTTSCVTQLLETWKLSSDESDTWEGEGPIPGYITAQITFFGLPDGHCADEDENIFELSLLLVDNKTKVDYIYNVGHLITRDPEKENTWNLELSIGELPNVVPEGATGAGFNATVDDWEDGEDISIGV